MSVREHHWTGVKRGNYNHGWNGGVEGNWNANPKSLAAGQIHSCKPIDRLNLKSDLFTEGLPDNTWYSYGHESIPHYSQNGLDRNSNFNDSQNVSHSLFPIAAMNTIGFSNGASVPLVAVLYPFDHNFTDGFQGEQPGFGSPGSVDLPDIDEQSPLSEGNMPTTFQNSRHSEQLGHQPSPDQPSPNIIGGGFNESSLA